MKEWISWNPDGNFDRHDAFGMMMLLREDKLRLIGTRSPSEMSGEGEKDYLGEDPFFKRNFDNFKKKKDYHFDGEGVFHSFRDVNFQ